MLCKLVGLFVLLTCLYQSVDAQRRGGARQWDRDGPNNWRYNNRYRNERRTLESDIGAQNFEVCCVFQLVNVAQTLQLSCANRQFVSSVIWQKNSTTLHWNGSRWEDMKWILQCSSFRSQRRSSDNSRANVSSLHHTHTHTTYNWCIVGCWNMHKSVTYRVAIVDRGIWQSLDVVWVWRIFSWRQFNTHPWHNHYRSKTHGATEESVCAARLILFYYV